MTNIKSKKGITLVSLVITIVVLLILTGTVIYRVSISNGTERYNKMAADIKLLNDKILLYYNKYGEIPKTDREIRFKKEGIGFVKYYEIDLSKLEGLTLNYGNEYGKTEELTEDSDVYLINSSLHVYYLKGVKKSEEIFHFVDNNENYSYNDMDQYTELEYIEGTGTQYIDTGLKLNQNSKVELKAQITEDGDYNIFGSRSSATENNFAILFSNLSHNLVSADFQNYNKNRLSTEPSSEEVVYKISNQQLEIGDKTKNISGYTAFTTPENAYIFDISGNKPTYNLAKMNLYYCKIWDNGTLVRDFIPCKDSDGVVCLYDKVEGKYYYNQGTGDFVAGPEV